MGRLSRSRRSPSGRLREAPEPFAHGGLAFGRATVAATQAGGYGGAMRCPFCSADDDKVVDSRPADDGAAVRRRRECLACSRRFTTYERVDELPFTVVKRGGEREPFDPEKVRSGVERAVAGSAIEPAAVDELVAEVEERLRAIGPEVTSEQSAERYSRGCGVSIPCPTCGSPRSTRASRTSATSSVRSPNSRSRPSPNAASRAPIAGTSSARVVVRKLFEETLAMTPL